MSSHAEDQPRIANKAKLRTDPKTGRKVLLSPEKGLILNGTGERILSLCDGARSFSQIVDELLLAYSGGERATLEREASAFLDQLAERSLIEGWSR